MYLWPTVGRLECEVLMNTDKLLTEPCRELEGTSSGAKSSLSSSSSLLGRFMGAISCSCSQHFRSVEYRCLVSPAFVRRRVTRLDLEYHPGATSLNLSEATIYQGSAQGLWSVSLHL